MTGTRALPLMTTRDDVQRLAWDLSRASGTLSEIATTWRRSWQEMPQLPLGLPLRLRDTARQLAADAQSLGEAAPESGQAAFLAGELAALSADAAAARALTCGPDGRGIGDTLLWESLTADLGRAATRLRAVARSAA